MTPGSAERLGTEFDGRGGRPLTGEESRAAVRRLYDGVISTGRTEDVDMVAENNRLGSRSVWDGTITQSGRPADFTSQDFFRIERCGESVVLAAS